MKRLALVLACVLLASPALAQHQLKLPDPLHLNPQSAESQAAANQTPTCDFNTFTVLTPSNVVAQLQACGEKLLADSTAALKSAAAANDNIASACLTPGTALIQAAVGTPAQPEVPANGATPAVPAVAASLPGPILIFQKFREFVNNGGITNCKAWVNNTVTAATASGL